MIYSDEAITGENLDTILRVDARPAFSYDHYLGHPYFVHLIAARTELVRKVGGLNEEMSISQDVDLNLRLIEVCQTICHVPEVLYRWRTHPASLGHQKMHQCRASTRQALERHFARTRQAVLFEDESHFNYRNVRFQHNWRARVVILVVAWPPPSTSASAWRVWSEPLTRHSRTLSSSTIRRTAQARRGIWLMCGNNTTW